MKLLTFALRERFVPNQYSFYSTKIYVVGAQKNRLNETVLLSTQNKCLGCQMDKMIIMILHSNFCISQPMVDYVLQSPTEVPSSDPLENLNMLDFYGQRPWRQGHQSKLKLWIQK